MFSMIANGKIPIHHTSIRLENSLSNGLNSDGSGTPPNYSLTKSKQQINAGEPPLRS
ncbi:hypothetical protein LguiB_028326 [Lonicera macranthoides]